MLSKKRHIADQDRVIAEKLLVIETLERHPWQAHTVRAIAECRRIIAQCELSKSIIRASLIVSVDSSC
jgi:hypothetical protein